MAGLPFFAKEGDYEAFERVMVKALEHVPGMRLVGYCLLPNPWHLVLWPRADGELSDFMPWLTLTPTQRWHAHYPDVGNGHLYQGRFKSFPIEATIISWRCAAMWSAMPCVPAWRSVPRPGAGAVWGGAWGVTRTGVPAWVRVPYPGRPSGRRMGTNRKRKRKWRPYGAVSSAVNLMAGNAGSSAQRSAWV